CMRGAEADRQAERSSRLAACQELHCLRPEVSGGMSAGRVFGVEERATLTWQTPPVVEFSGHRPDILADAELADEAGAVACLAEQRRVSLRPSGGGERGREVVDAVPSDVLTAENRGPADGTDRGGDEAVGKEDTLA